MDKKRILAVLNAAEWAVDNDFGDAPQCPVCSAFEGNGHEKDCDLAILKNELEGGKGNVYR